MARWRVCSDVILYREFKRYELRRVKPVLEAEDWQGSHIVSALVVEFSEMPCQTILPSLKF